MVTVISLWLASVESCLLERDENLIWPNHAITYKSSPLPNAARNNEGPRSVAVRDPRRAVLQALSPDAALPSTRSVRRPPTAPRREHPASESLGRLEVVM
jgi:hypothetical protein